MIIALLLLSPTLLYAQMPPSKLAQARQFVLNDDIENAIKTYKEAYDEAPFDKLVYNEYLATLLKAKKYTEAESLVEYMSNIRREDASILIDLGKVYELSGKTKKAEEHYDKAIATLKGDDYNTRAIADAFIRNDKKDYAIKAYEATQAILQNPYLYATQLAMLYAETGATKGALDALMNTVAIQPAALEDVKAAILKMTESDINKLDEIQKEISNRIKNEPNNYVWKDIQNWLFAQKGDYEKALQATISQDKKQKEDGQNVLSFANYCIKDKKYDVAVKAYDYILNKKEVSPFFEQALVSKIQVENAMLQNQMPIDNNLLQTLLKDYDTLFTHFPVYSSQPLRRDYAFLLARYAHKPDSAIHILNELIAQPRLQKEFIGNVKLDLGDYLVLQQKLWDASLIYSQVDKDFKQDMLGEEARFRNAKLAYYRGDFEWAQTQLSVLKSSTTELIANDALYLSVLITENTPPDSNLAPLLRFAAADLLMFQFKSKEADQLLDSIAKAFPENPLQDDILMQRGKIAEEEGRYNDAIDFYQKTVKDFGDDVLADDAVFRLGTLYQNKIKDKAKAIEYYEKLIVDYPGSTWVQQARAQYNELKNKKAIP